MTNTSSSFADDTGELLSLLVWFLFGAAMIVPAFEHLVWQDIVFALLALTIIRMVPVAIALAGTGLDRATVLFVGWFGHGGLASVVFALIAYDSLDPSDANYVISAVGLTVVLSVVAHGITAAPFATRYGRHAAGLHPDQPEHATTPRSGHARWWAIRGAVGTGRHARPDPLLTTEGPSMAQEIEITRASLRTPRAAAIAGIAFALLLGTALVLVRLAVPPDPPTLGPG